MSEFTYEGIQISAEDGETVLGALIRHSVAVRHGCRAGACQACLLRSTEPVPKSAQVGLDEVVVERGGFLACQAKASEILSAEPFGSEVFPSNPAILEEKRNLADDVLLLRFVVPGWDAHPGRFIRLSHQSGVTRPYSLAAPAWADKSEVQLHVRLIPGGAMSSLLVGALLGEEFAIEGPFGKCAYRAETKEEPILLVGSGTGLAPLYGIATDALHSGHRGPISLYHGAATSDRLYFRRELRELSDRFPNFHYIGCVDQAVADPDVQGSPLDRALGDHSDLTGYRVYLCGHPALVRTAQRKCFLAGAALKHIAADPFEAA